MDNQGRIKSVKAFIFLSLRSLLRISNACFKELLDNFTVFQCNLIDVFVKKSGRYKKEHL
ncbi:hypothetical protein J6TS2_19660 [Heyndrickxia sporothermodurans]|nr:hypothetical protein J6TS2_19660 [Heyndrickxia sporothermodurans]